MPEMPKPDHVPTVTASSVSGDAVILDVREPDEWRAGHVAGALHVPMGAVADRIVELPDTARIVVLCRSGGRSARVTAYLRTEGLDAVNLDGGIHAWVGAGREIVDDSGAPGAVA